MRKERKKTYLWPKRCRRLLGLLSSPVLPASPCPPGVSLSSRHLPVLPFPPSLFRRCSYCSSLSSLSSFRCRSVVLPCRSLSSLSLLPFHPQSTPRAVAHEAGHGRCCSFVTVVSCCPTVPHRHSPVPFVFRRRCRRSRFLSWPVIHPASRGSQRCGVCWVGFVVLSLSSPILISI
jgi:hypothetical protein